MDVTGNNYVVFDSFMLVSFRMLQICDFRILGWWISFLADYTYAI